MDRYTATPPLPLYHNPIIAISLVLILAAIAQVGIWLVNTRIRTSAITPPSSVTVHGMLYNLGIETVARQYGQSGGAEKITFIMCLLISLLSAVAWYAAARSALSPSWALWASLFWVVHPSFAFLAPRPGALTLLIALVPVTWSLMLWWKRSGRYWIAFLVGTSLGLISLLSFDGFLLFPLVLLVMLVGTGRRGSPWLDAPLLLAGYVLLVVPALVWTIETGRSGEIEKALVSDWWKELALGAESPIAESAREFGSHPVEQRPFPFKFLIAQLTKEPRSTILWFTAKLWRTLYSTSDHRLQRPLFVLQLLCLVPAIWGYIVALRYAPWRWAAVSAGLFIAVIWAVAALGEPLARNLTPIGGMGIIFALVGVVDVYERIFGRRLTGYTSPE